MAGDATFLYGKCYELTPKGSNPYNKEAAIWNQDPIDLSQDFSMCFMANFGNNTNDGADGIAWVIKSTSTATTGGKASNIGYKYLSKPNLAVEFDTYFNDPNSGQFPIDAGDIPDDHVAMVKNGDQINAIVPAAPVLAGGGNIEDGVYHKIGITWDATSYLLEVYFDGNLVCSLSQNIVSTIFNNDPTVYWGITASTGWDWNRHRICLDCCEENMMDLQYDYIAAVDHNDIAYSLKASPDAGLIIGGSTRAVSSDPYPIVMKDNGEGNPLWQFRYKFKYGNTWLETGEVFDVEYTNAANILACGYLNNVNEDAFVMSLHPDGTIDWSTLIFEDPNERAHDIELVDGYTPHAGFSIAYTGFHSKSLLVGNLSLAGNENWTWIISGDPLQGANPADELEGWSIQPIDDINDQDNQQDDGYVLCGNLYPNGDRTNPSAFYARLDANGSVVWFKTFANATARCIKQVYVDLDLALWKDKYVITGDLKVGGPSGDSYTYVLEVDGNGNVNQINCFGKPGNNTSGIALEQFPDGSYGLSGNVGSATSIDPFMAQVSSGGSLLWHKLYGDVALPDLANSVEWLNPCQLIAAGAKSSPSGTHSDMYIFTGNFSTSNACSERASGFITSSTQLTPNDYPIKSVDHWSVEVLDDEAAVPVAFSPDQCSSSGSIPPDAMGGGSTFMTSSEVSIYPNPIGENEDLLVSLGSNMPEMLNVVIRNLQGQVLRNEILTRQSGEHQLNIGTSDLSKGTYIIQVLGASGGIHEQLFMKI